MERQGEQRPDPEVLLRQVQAEETYAKRGRLKIFLGYTSGVGKSFRMFDERDGAANAVRTLWSERFNPA